MNHCSPANLQETLFTQGPIFPSYALVAQEEETDECKWSPFTPLPALVHVVEEPRSIAPIIEPNERVGKQTTEIGWRGCANLIHRNFLNKACHSV